MTNFEILRSALTSEQQIELDKCKDIWVEGPPLSCAYDILESCFIWSTSPQGLRYWSEIWETLCVW